MSYTNLSNGSRGEDVRKLQQALVDAGYSVGSTGVDGIYGSNTAAAVRSYQQANGLSVDGIAGNETLGKLYGSATSTPAAATPSTDTTGATSPAETGTAQKAPDYSQYAYDPSANKAYQDALAALQQAQQALPSYKGTYDQQLQDIYNQIVNRDKFSYDVNSDALYQQYKDQYVTLGQQAMMDTMGQAQAMTGGYGNSYAQSVGQQTYQAYLQQLTDKVPELYGMALDQYNQEGQNLMNQYSMVGDMADDEYAKYQDSLNQYWQNLSYQKELADDAYSQGYDNWYQSYQMGVEADKVAYSKQQDAYDKLVSLITTTGYSPSAEELKAAGMSDAQAAAYKSYYDKQNTPTYSGGGGGSSGGGSSSSKSSSSSRSGYNNGSVSSSQIKDMQRALGVTADGMWGSQSQAAAKAAWGTSSADSAWSHYTTKVRVPGGPANAGSTSSSSNPLSGLSGAGDYEAYFAAYRQKNGASAAQSHLSYCLSKGWIPQNMVTYASSGARGGQMGH